MVSLDDVQFSNARIASTLPPGLVAVFVGATNGIGETTLKQFAKHARQPRVYFVGRSDDVCRDIKSKEKSVNLLFLSTGTLIPNVGMSAILPEIASVHTENKLQG